MIYLLVVGGGLIILFVVAVVVAEELNLRSRSSMFRAWDEMRAETERLLKAGQK